MPAATNILVDSAFGADLASDPASAATAVDVVTAPHEAADLNLAAETPRLAPLAAIVGLDDSGDATLIGDLLCLGGGAASAIYTAVPAPLVPRHGPLKVTAWVMLFSLIVAIPFGIPGIPALLADIPSPAAWSTIVYAAAAGSVLANILWFRAIDRRGVTRTIVYIYLEPVVAIALAALFLAEAIGPAQAIGGLLAILGVALVQRD